MKQGFSTAADAVLQGTVTRAQGVPGVIAMATNRSGNIYEGAFGKRDLSQPAAMTTDTVMAIFSCTKAVTGVAVMQLVEEGKIGLHDAAKKYVPEIADIMVLDGFDAQGVPKVRRPKSDITVSQLLLHTAGFGYDFFNHDLVKYGAAKNVPSVVSASLASMRSVLLHDPGTAWEYGSNIDWVGKVVENVRGKRLGEVMAERIFTPLGMSDTGFTMTPSMRARRASMHARSPEGVMSAMSDFELTQEPEQHMGGHGLYSTIGDYMKFVRMVLNDGAGPNGARVLKAATIDQMTANALGDMKIKMLPGAIPSLSNDAEFFPGMPKSWGYTWMINDQQAPTGRPAGAVAWAGLANLYYWIDRKNNVGGMWGTQILPFVDGVSVPGYMDFEKTVYDHLA
jgi:methyl acetate hydrolase